MPLCLALGPGKGRRQRVPRCGARARRRRLDRRGRGTGAAGPAAACVKSLRLSASALTIHQARIEKLYTIIDCPYGPLAFRETKGGRFERLAQLLTAGLQRGDLGLHRLMLAEPRGGEQRFRGDSESHGLLRAPHR